MNEPNENDIRREISESVKWKEKNDFRVLVTLKFRVSSEDWKFPTPLNGGIRAWLKASNNKLNSIKDTTKYWF